MVDSVIAGTGNSRYLRTSLSASTTWEDALTMLRAGTFPIDLAGINLAGFTTLGTALNSATLLKSAVITALGLDADATPSDAWDAVIALISEKADADSTVTSVAYNSSTHKLTVTIDGVTTDVVTITPPPVNSVNTKTGDVVLGSGDIAYSDSATYPSGSVGAEVADLKSAISGGGLTPAIKSALLQLAEKVAYIDDDGQDYYDALYAALYPPAGLVSIDAVFSPGAAVIYTTTPLDDLKQYLTVTATYDDTSTATVTAYTLSGTLEEGTNTITVTYADKTDTFSVVAVEWNTSPNVEYANYTLTNSGQLYALTGACVTAPYGYTLDVDSIKATSYYNAENNYVTMTGLIWDMKMYTPNSAGISFGSRGYSSVYASDDDSVLQVFSPPFSSSPVLTEKRSNSEDSDYFTLSDNKLYFRFALVSADVDNSYAYWSKKTIGGVDYGPFLGVNDGDIIFAGENTPYYGCHNISEATP